MEQTHKPKLISAIITGVLSTTASIGTALFTYNWWDQIRILFPAYGGRYAFLSKRFSETAFNFLSFLLL